MRSLIRDTLLEVLRDTSAPAGAAVGTAGADTSMFSSLVTPGEQKGVRVSVLVVHEGLDGVEAATGLAVPLCRSRRGGEVSMPICDTRFPSGRRVGAWGAAARGGGRITGSVSNR